MRLVGPRDDGNETLMCVDGCALLQGGVFCVTSTHVAHSFTRCERTCERTCECEYWARVCVGGLYVCVVSAIMYHYLVCYTVRTPRIVGAHTSCAVVARSHT